MLSIIFIYVCCRYFVDHSALLQAVKYANLLRGPSRHAVSGWLEMQIVAAVVSLEKSYHLPTHHLHTHH
jgi:hypothetical protein